MDGASLLRDGMYWCAIREYIAHLGHGWRDRLMILQLEVRAKYK